MLRLVDLAEVLPGQAARDRSSDWMTACGSGATVKTTGMSSSRATSAAARLPTSAMRRCSRSTPPAARRMRRMPRRVATRSGHAAADRHGLAEQRDAAVVVAGAVQRAQVGGGLAPPSRATG